MLTVICEQFDSAYALQRIESIAGDGSAEFEQKLFYPYFHLTARCSVPTMIGRKELTVDCLVDAINGSGATTDPFSTEELTVPREIQLQPIWSHDEAVRVARRTLTHRLGKKMRMIAPFDVVLESTTLIYRGFWIVRVGTGRIMLDSVTGGMQSLRASAATQTVTSMSPVPKCRDVRS